MFVRCPAQQRPKGIEHRDDVDQFRKLFVWLSVPGGVPQYFVAWEWNFPRKDWEVVDQTHHREDNKGDSPETVIRNALQHQLPSEQRAAKDRARDGEIDNQSRDINQRCDQWSRGTGRVESKFSKTKRQHGSSNCTEQNDTNEAGADSCGDPQVMRPIQIFSDAERNRLPQQNASDADHAQHAPQDEPGSDFTSDDAPPVTQADFT